MKRRFYFKDGRVEEREVDDTPHIYWNVHVPGSSPDPFEQSMWWMPPTAARTIVFERRVTHTPNGPEFTYHEVP